MNRPIANDRLDSEIERLINVWDGTIKGWQLKNMYENGSSYETICDFLDIDYSDYEEESYDNRTW